MARRKSMSSIHSSTPNWYKQDMGGCGGGPKRYSCWSATIFLYFEDLVSVQVDIFAHDLVLLPIHLGTHWCCAAINFGKKQFQYYDSLRGSNGQCLSALRWVSSGCVPPFIHMDLSHSLRLYIASESRDKKQQEFDLSAWTDYSPKVRCALFRVMLNDTLFSHTGHSPPDKFIGLWCIFVLGMLYWRYIVVTYPMPLAFTMLTGILKVSYITGC